MESRKRKPLIFYTFAFQQIHLANGGYTGADEGLMLVNVWIFVLRCFNHFVKITIVPPIHKTEPQFL